MITAALIYAVTFAIAAGVAASATPLILRLTKRLGLLHAAAADRHMHTEPRPRVGGVAVYLGFAVALFAVLGLALSSPYSLEPSLAHATAAHRLELITGQFETVHRLVGLLFGSLLILGVGL